MIAYIVRRLIFLPFVWLAVTLVIFALMQALSPRQRLALYVNVNPESFSSKLTPEAYQRLIDKFGINDPFYVQYAKWLGQVAHGNFGWSKTAQTPVLQAIKERFPTSLELTLYAIAPVVLIALWMGITAAVHRGQWQDHLTRAVTIVGAAFPSFVFALLALLVFYGKLQWFPPGRLSLTTEQIVYSSAFTRFTGLVTLDAVLNGRFDILVEAWRHLFLPVVTWSFGSWVALTQVTRSAMLEALGQDYVTAARAKGVPERQVVYSHARRNAMIPVVTLGVGSVIGLILGVFITETIFNINGLGRLGVQAALSFDVPTELGITVFDTGMIIMTNLLMDILYTVVDPRVRFS